ncbi:MAG: phosphate/phosphite/phosphonate ABC transporter substrate-binding protein [Nitrospinae bacterium]|nr:phosphate/phosphite/phosphonate ABC transporter substrate-binding protein [Nitrospinota bacterium]
MKISQTNKRYLVILSTLFLVLGVWGISKVTEKDKEAPGSDQLKIVFISYDNPEQLIDNVKPVVAYLEAQLGMAVKHFVATDYAGVVEALRNETADMGFMGPLQYIMTHDQAGAIPILGEVYKGQSWYMSRIFVRKDSGIKSLEDLRGRTIAFVDPLSSSGYMYPLDIFKQAGLIKDKESAESFFKEIIFAGGDEQAIRAVYNKFVDAAGVGQFSFSLLRPEEREEFITIGDSKRIPSHCVVVRKGLSPEVIDKLQNALFALNDGEHKKLLKNLYGVDGYIKVTHEDYKEVEEMAREYGFLKDQSP